jgi:hypothetical protein
MQARVFVSDALKGFVEFGLNQLVSIPLFRVQTLQQIHHTSFRECWKLNWRDLYAGGKLSLILSLINHLFACQITSSNFEGQFRLLVNYPLIVILTVIRADYQNHSNISTIRTIYKQGGILGFFVGLIPALMGGFLYRKSTDFFTSYLVRFSSGEYFDEYSAKAFMLKGFVTSLSAIISYPFSTVQRVMIFSFLREGYMTPIQACNKIYTTTGLTGFFHGVSSNILRILLLSSLVTVLDFVHCKYLKHKTVNYL